MEIVTCKPARLEPFEKAMESVYGKFTGVADPSTWTPPPANGGHRGRYLWTDAFGVMNFLTLYQMHTQLGTENVQPERYLTFAKRLVAAVHDILGRTRNGTSRLALATELEPLAGGLRIGKVDVNGADCDGQYHHYITIWMRALNRLSMATRDPTYNRQAYSLGKAIHPHFLTGLDTDQPRMHWKLAMDLSRPLVASQGNLDPIDGYVTFSLVQASAREFGDGEVFEEEIANYKRVAGPELKYEPSLDMLDLGMAITLGQYLFCQEDWASNMINQCYKGLRTLFIEENYLGEGTPGTDVYRELGACVGMTCLFNRRGPNGEKFSYYADFTKQLIDQYEASTTKMPKRLKPITKVMYAAALIPGAFMAGFFGTEPINAGN
ncbi:hypothetical protein FQN49_001462 [Arthroderma sp. PD_2]|nr:hypothetical protein FQN49_001462 [Arthroderma sp. PD_2]